MNNKFSPIGNKVILLLEEKEKLTPGGIIIPDSVEDPPTIGTVVAVSETTSKDYNLEVGDEVLFGRHTAVKIKLNGKALHIIEIDKAYGIFKNEHA